MAEQRLIDASAMREFILCEMLNEKTYCANDFLDVIDEQPTVDALPVVQAHWICVDDEFGDWQCSSCKEVQRVYDGTPEENNMNFCSACGAMMCEECEQDER